MALYESGENPGFNEWSDASADLFIETVDASGIPVSDLNENILDLYWDAFERADISSDERYNARQDFFYEMDMAYTDFDWAQWREDHDY